jgi:hypothetical protein
LALALTGAPRARPAGAPPSRLAWLPVSILALSIAGLLVYYHSIYGSWSLSAAYGPGFASDVSLARVPEGIAGILFDRQFGLLLFAPVLLLAIPGAIRWPRRDVRFAAVLIAASTATLAVGGSFSMWWGGASPPARFAIAATPALAILATALFEWSASARALLRGLTGFGAGALMVALLAPRALHNRPDGQNGLLRVLAPKNDFDCLLPSFLPRGLVPDRESDCSPGLDAFRSTTRLLERWDDSRRAFGPPQGDRRDSFILDLPRGRDDWNVGPGEADTSPRFTLPRGSWRLSAETAVFGSDEALNAARLALIRDDETSLVEAFAQRGQPWLSATFEVRDSDRRLRLRITGVQARTTLLRARATPAAP